MGYLPAIAARDPATCAAVPLSSDDAARMRVIAIRLAQAIGSAAARNGVGVVRSTLVGERHDACAAVPHIAGFDPGTNPGWGTRWPITQTRREWTPSPRLWSMSLPALRADGPKSCTESPNAAVPSSSSRARSRRGASGLRCGWASRCSYTSGAGPLGLITVSVVRVAKRDPQGTWVFDEPGRKLHFSHCKSASVADFGGTSAADSPSIDAAR